MFLVEIRHNGVTHADNRSDVFLLFCRYENGFLFITFLLSSALILVFYPYLCFY